MTKPKHTLRMQDHLHFISRKGSRTYQNILFQNFPPISFSTKAQIQGEKRQQLPPLYGIGSSGNLAFCAEKGKAADQKRARAWCVMICSTAWEWWCVLLSTVDVKGQVTFASHKIKQIRKICSFESSQFDFGTIWHFISFCIGTFWFCKLEVIMSDLSKDWTKFRTYNFFLSKKLLFSFIARFPHRIWSNFYSRICPVLLFKGSF